MPLNSREAGNLRRTAGKETTMKYGNLTLGQIEAGINKIGGEDAFMRLLAGELNVVPAKPSDPKKLLELVTTTSVAMNVPDPKKP